MSFTGLTPEICKKALDLIMPAIENAAKTGTVKRFAGSFVVLCPFAKLWAVDNLVAQDGLAKAKLDPRFIMFEQAIGEPSQGLDFKEIARSKALVSLVSGLPSGVAQQRLPIFYTEGMTKWHGSTVRDGLIVAFSGVEGHYDEMFSEWLASAIIGLCRHEMLKPGGVMAQDGDYL